MPMPGAMPKNIVPPSMARNIVPLDRPTQTTLPPAVMATEVMLVAPPTNHCCVHVAPPSVVSNSLFCAPTKACVAESAATYESYALEIGPLTSFHVAPPSIVSSVSEMPLTQATLSLMAATLVKSLVTPDDCADQVEPES